MKPEDARAIVRKAGACGFILPPPPHTNITHACILAIGHDGGKHEDIPSRVIPEGMTVAQVEAALAYARTQGATDDSPVMLEHTVYDDGSYERESLEAVDDGSLMQANVIRVIAQSRCQDGPPTVYIDVEHIAVS